MDEYQKQLTENKDSDTVFNKHLFRNISLLSSLLIFALIIMIIVDHYERDSLDQGESSSAQILLHQ